MKNYKILKKIIIFFAILFIIILITLRILFLANYNRTKDTLPKEIIDAGENGDTVANIYGQKSGEGVDAQTYLNVKACVQKYVNIINLNSYLYGSYDELGNYTELKNSNEIKAEIFNILSNKYVKDNNITIDNIYDYVKTLKDARTFIPLEIKLINEGDIKSFIAYGLIGSLPYYDETEKICVIINIDFKYGRFSVEPLYEEFNNINEIKINNYESVIENKKVNNFTISVIQSSTIPTEYVNLIKGLSLGAPEILYNLLNNEYRNLKFGNLEEFKQYINKNKDKISRIKLEEYNIQGEGNNKTFICTDQNKNKYIINQKQPFQDYNVTLDGYTIDLPEFIDNYNKSTEENKTLLNIRKLISALKNDDYKYVYDKMDKSFRDSKFNTVNDFENYIKNKLPYEDIQIKYEKYNKINDVNVFEIEITNSNVHFSQVTNYNVAMKLMTNREFVFSFGEIEN